MLDQDPFMHYAASYSQDSPALPDPDTDLQQLYPNDFLPMSSPWDDRKHQFPVYSDGHYYPHHHVPAPAPQPVKQEPYSPTKLEYDYLSLAASPLDHYAQSHVDDSSPDHSLVGSPAFYTPPVAHADIPAAYPMSAHPAPSPLHLMTSPISPTPAARPVPQPIQPPLDTQIACDPRFVSGSTPIRSPNSTVSFGAAFGTSPPALDLDADGSVEAEDSGEEEKSSDDEDADADADDPDYVYRGRTSYRSAPYVVPSQAGPSSRIATRAGGARPTRPSRVTAPEPVPNLTKKSRGRRVPTSSTVVIQNGVPKATRTYMCKVKDCGKCFARGEHLKRHVRSIHTNEKRKYFLQV